MGNPNFWGESNPPCHNCENRCVGCHSTCESYLAFRKKRDAYNKERAERFAEERRIIETILHSKPRRKGR